MFHRRDKIEAKTDTQIVGMRQAGLVVHDTLAMVRARVAPGVTTGELDAAAEDFIRAAGAVPSFQQVPGYRHTLCVSVNDEVVHGIPGDRVLGHGDVVSIDCGAELGGWHGDSAITVIVGGPHAAEPSVLALVAATEAALWAGIGACRVGARLNEVGAAVEDAVVTAEESLPPGEESSLGIVEGYTGHGIGRQMHMAPDVHNYRVRGRTPVIPPGATLAIEPMVVLGSGRTFEGADGWTVRTVDGGAAAHWEHTIAVTAGGVWVLTAQDGGRARLADLGIPYAPLGGSSSAQM